VAAWEQALTRAARNGYISSHTFLQHSGDGKVQRRKANHLTLHVSEGLLRDLEIPELGRPVALGAVFVRSSYIAGIKCGIWCPELRHVIRF
jgi:charged multivesicular body protein 7